MKNDEVIITDEYIVLKENTRSVVMAKGAKSITEIYSYVVCQNGGDVLDIGFGMGFSANKMSELADTYTCIEINPQIYQTAIEWSKDKPNVEIIFGDWVDIIPTLDKKFDGIFFDTHNDPNSHLSEEYAKLVSKEGTIFSHWNYFQIRDIKELNIYKCSVDENSMPKATNLIHNVNWTHYIDGEFVKGSNKIKFHEANKVI
jgi:predicted O-methyltransferase YrrM